MLKQHFDTKKGFDQILGKYHFYIQLQEREKNTHLFTVKITEAGNIHTKIRVQGPISVEVYSFIRYYDHDILDNIPIPESEKFYMYRFKKSKFTPVQSMTMDLFQLSKFMQQLYEIKFHQFQVMNQKNKNKTIQISKELDNNSCVVNP